MNIRGKTIFCLVTLILGLKRLRSCQILVQKLTLFHTVENFQHSLSMRNWTPFLETFLIINYQRSLGKTLWRLRVCLLVILGQDLTFTFFTSIFFVNTIVQIGTRFITELIVCVEIVDSF